MQSFGISPLPTSVLRPTSRRCTLSLVTSVVTPAAQPLGACPNRFPFHQSG